MHLLFKPRALTLSLLCIISLSGCATEQMMDYNDLFLTHRSPLVRYPAWTGFVAGGAVGTPVWCVYFPVCLLSIVTGTVMPADGDAVGAMFVNYPILLGGTIGVTLLAGPFWLMCDPWWPEQNKTEPVPAKEKKLDQSLSKTDLDAISSRGP